MVWFVIKAFGGKGLSKLYSGAPRQVAVSGVHQTTTIYSLDSEYKTSITKLHYIKVLR
jgi:hypothetical protein